MTKSKKDKTEKKEDSLLVALTVTSICAAAVIGYVAGQVKMADTVFRQINMMISSTPVEEDTSEAGSKLISTANYNDLVKACEAIMSDSTSSDDKAEEMVEPETME